MSRFVRILFCLLGFCGARSLLSAQPLFVGVTASYENGGAKGYLTLGDPLEISISGAGNGSDSKQVEFFLDQPVFISVVAYDVTNYQVAFTPPAGFGMVIEGVRRNTIRGVPPGAGLIKVSLVRAAAVADQNTPTGEVSSIQWVPPTSAEMQDKWPFLVFNLGSGRNGQALPALHLPVGPRTAQSAEFVPPDSPEISNFVPSGGAFQLSVPQADVRLRLNPGTPGNFTLEFLSPGTTTVFATYVFEILAWAGDAINQFKRIRVTKEILGGLSFETQIEGTFNELGINRQNGSWTIEDWHTVGSSPARVLVGSRTRTLTGIGIVPTEFRVTGVTTDTVHVKPSVSSPIPVESTFSVYLEHSIGSSPDFFHVIMPQQTMEGFGEGNYVTQHWLSPSVDIARGTTDPAGRVRLIEESMLPATGQLTHTIYETWLDASPSFNGSGTGFPVVANGGLVTTILDEPDPRWRIFQWPQSIERKVGPVVVGKSTFSYEETTVGQGATVVAATRRDYASPTSYLESVAKRFRPDVSDISLRNQLYSLQSPSGAKQSFAYASGDFSNGAADFRVTILSGTATGGNLVNAVDGTGIDALHLRPLESTKTVEYLRRGRLVRREVWVYQSGNGSAPLFNSGGPVAWETFAYNTDSSGNPLDGRLVSHTTSSGTSFSATWSGTRKTQQKDETDLITSFDYDELDRVKRIDRHAGGGLPARQTHLEYDAAHRIRFHRIGATGGEQLSTETEYDRGGRIKRLKQPGPGTETSAGTIVTEFTPLNGGRDLQTTLSATGATQLVTRHADGRLKSITGSAVVNEYFSYDFDATNRRRATRKLGPQQKRATSTVVDWLGRPAEERVDGFGPSGNQKPLVTFLTYYPDSGLPHKEYTVEHGSNLTVSATRIHTYDAFGRLKASGIDLNGNGTLDVLSTDRFVEFADTFVLDGTTWWRRASQKVYHTDNTAAFHERWTDQRLTGLTGIIAQTSARDFHGNYTTRTVTVDSAGKRSLVRSRLPDNTTRETSLVSGLVVSERWHDDTDPALTGTPTQSTSYNYDALGRITHVTDARTGSVETRYWFGTALPREQRDARGVIVAGMTYDGAGRLASRSDPVGLVSYTYSSRNEVIETSGSGTQPTRHTYTDYGEPRELKTFRNSLTGSPDVTTWTYDDNTGWPVAKLDASGQMQSFDYTFESGYRNVFRHSARNPGAPVKSRYATATGELVKLDYSDGTIDVDFLSYDRLGNLKQVQDATGLRSFAYETGQLTSELLPAWFNNLVLTADYQGATSASENTVTGRFHRWKLGPSADLDRELSTTYDYDNFGRINKVTAAYKTQGARPALSVPTSYSYRPNSSHWETLTQENFSSTRSFEPARDILTAVTSLHSGGGTLATFGYGTDNAGRREWATQSGMAFHDFVDSATDATYYIFRHNAAHELESARGYRGTNPSSEASPLPGRGFGFTYDTAGNRKTASVSGESVSYWDSTGGSGNNGANALNQPRSRGTLKSRVSGTSDKAAVVTLGGSGLTATREASPGRYWDAALPTFGQYGTVNVNATINGQTQSANVQVLTRPAVESLTYDADGNLTQDSLWIYEWDAENRLKRMSTTPTAVAWGAPDRELLFTYDYLGRRVRKISRLNGSTLLDRKYIYAGWSLLAELETATNKIARSYTWGLDIDSSLGGTGGVGGLLLETLHSDTTLHAYHVCHDGSGNVAALATRKPGDPTDGRVVAAYEYGPFGETVRAWVAPTLSPEIRDAFATRPFRYSTKFTDSETNLVYYGYRYYDPSLGRFINRDPIGESGGLNLYAFTGNSPVNGYDYLGLNGFWQSILDWFSGKNASSSEETGGYKYYPMPFHPNEPVSTDDSANGTAADHHNSQTSIEQAQTTIGKSHQRNEGLTNPKSGDIAIGFVVTRGLPEAIVEGTATRGAVSMFTRLNPIAFVVALLTPTTAGAPGIENFPRVSIREGFVIPDSANPDLVTEFFSLRASNSHRAREVLMKIWNEADIQRAYPSAIYFPRGFKNKAQFDQAVAELRAALRQSGITDGIIGVRGSSITGISSNPNSRSYGQPFGPNSDIDVFVMSSQITSVFGGKGFVHPDQLLDAYPALEVWSDRWAKELGRPITPAGWKPGSLPNTPAILRK